MAINPNTKYPGRITAPTLAYPYGSSKNETSPGAGDGTPYELARADDIFGFQQALLAAASITPSGNSDTALVSEYLQAIVEIASGRAFNYDESGIADVYVFDVQANQQGPRSYFDGMIVKAFPGFTNTGASTGDVNGLGVLNIKLLGGVLDPSAGDLTAGIETTLIYRSSPSAHLELQRLQAGTVATGSYTFTSVGVGATPSIITIAHGLGTDDLDIGLTVRGSVDSIANAQLFTANGGTASVVGLGAPPAFISTSPGLPAAGNLGIVAINNSTGTQNLIIDWWARVR